MLIMRSTFAAKMRQFSHVVSFLPITECLPLVEEFSHDTNPYVEPYERGPIFICRGLHGNLEAFWPKVKFWY